MLRSRSHILYANAQLGASAQVSEHSQHQRLVLLLNHMCGLSMTASLMRSQED